MFPHHRLARMGETQEFTLNWMGNLLERGPGGNSEPASRLEQVSGEGAAYGIVGYTHAGGVDRPLVAYKTQGGYSGEVVIPHMNWRRLQQGHGCVRCIDAGPMEWPGFRTIEAKLTTTTVTFPNNHCRKLLPQRCEPPAALHQVRIEDEGLEDDLHPCLGELHAKGGGRE
jgi:hypothetical protein